MARLIHPGGYGIVFFPSFDAVSADELNQQPPQLHRISPARSAMSTLLSPSRLSAVAFSLACHRPLFRSSTTPRPVSIIRFGDLGFRGLSSKAYLAGDLVRSSPGRTNLFRVPTSYSPGAAVSRVYSMATSDAGPSIVVYVTVPNKETGTKLAHGIIENKLAACVNQIPGVESTYWWEGKVETDTEILLMIKTRQSLLGELTDHVKNNHPYDTPEVIALPITGGSEKYLKWIGDNTKNAEIA
ncbi:hypothetical protein KC19_8G153900 [Ceratodon purpureus]|uniref:Protein CutA, chloroplastic n=1 Tax=Ceratodon purpureus TaxID=3225 RepID=A0A8T0GYT8_CERPU|nr:hypothetical protein KC19_8G153900 [Ceratodon purpureus]